MNGRAAALVQRFVFILFIFIEHAHCVMVSDRSKGDDPDEATSDVTMWKPARQLLTLGRRTCDAVAACCEGCQATRTHLVQSMRSANVRADAIVFNSALSAYARNRLTLWKPARQLPRDMRVQRQATHAM
jgi:hypothetical protein